MKELERIQRLKVALRYAVQGRGIGAAVVEVFRRGDRSERETARRILLGVPVRESVSELVRRSREPASDLVRFVVSDASINAVEAGRRAERLTRYFERWAETKERRALEQKAMEVRAEILAAVLGAVLAMVSSLAPILASFRFLSAPSVQSTNLFPSFGFCLCLISSSFLGLFASSRRPYIEPAVSSALFLAVHILVSPMLSFSIPVL
jgi:hypothetical protein